MQRIRVNHFLFSAHPIRLNDLTRSTDAQLLLHRYICSSIGKRLVRQKISNLSGLPVADLHMQWRTRKTMSKDGRWALQLWTLWDKQVLRSVCRSAATAVAGDNVDVWQLAMRVERCFLTMTASVSTVHARWRVGQLPPRSLSSLLNWVWWVHCVDCAVNVSTRPDKKERKMQDRKMTNQIA